MNKLAEIINEALNQYNEDLSVYEFADAISEILIDKYGKHNYMKFEAALSAKIWIEPESDDLPF